MRIVFASSEVVPFSKTGGLADVAGALPEAVARRGHEVTILTPRYGSVDVSAFKLKRRRYRLTVNVKGKPMRGGFLEGTTPSGVPVLFVDRPAYFGRKGLYGDRGKDYPDNDKRFAFFSRAVLEACCLFGISPDVIHCNDWQTGPIPVLLQSEYRERPELNSTGTVFTIHNLAYQGQFPPEAMTTLGLGWSLFTPYHLEFYGKVSFLKAGLVFADKLTTVSKKYAEEIRSSTFGHGLEGVINERADDLTGILNGVDYSTWDPRQDPFIAKTYSSDNLSGKSACKSDLQRRMGLPIEPDTPLAASISRLTSQKGIDLFIEVSKKLLKSKCQWVFLGEGDPVLENSLRQLAKQHPAKVSVRIGFDEELAHRIFAGADIFLMPSRYEPCGLNQIYGLRYGAIPLVHAVGGLDDTIEDVSKGKGSGFKFNTASPLALLETVQRALRLFSDRSAWCQLVDRAMSQDFSWEHSARSYETIYKETANLRQ